VLVCVMRICKVHVCEARVCEMCPGDECGPVHVTLVCVTQKCKLRVRKFYDNGQSFPNSSD
jgi:hypothetical protein